MSLSRALLICAQAALNSIALTPPNPTNPKTRYHTEEPSVLQIAPLIFNLHRYVFWTCTVFEILACLNSMIFPPLPSVVQTMICPRSQSNMHFTPLFAIGVLAVALGAYIRLDCFKALGHLFTFDLTVHPDHRLVTERFYTYVRHPSYTGSMLLVIGLTLSHLTPGSWLTECAVPYWFATALSAAWWAWTWSVGTSRAQAEDRQMRKLFQADWDAYAERVPWWFFPGLC